VLSKSGDQVHAARDLRGDRREAKTIEERLDLRPGDVGRGREERRVVSALSGRRDERPFEVEAERVGAVGWCRRDPCADAVGEGMEDREGRREAGREERRDAAPEKSS